MTVTPVPGAQGPIRVRALCPFLAGPDRAWRTLVASRDQLCTAVDPGTPITLDKQRRLCLTAHHTECATYRAALQTRPSSPTGGAGRAARDPDRPTRWALTRTTPVVMDHAWPLPLAGAARVAGNRGAQFGLAALMVLAFAAILVARLSGPGARPAGALDASLMPSASSTAAATPVGSPSPLPTSAPTPDPSPSVAPTPSATALATTTYRVRSGDTLLAIAARFGTTVPELQRLNDIEDPRRIRVGQVLLIPAPG